MSTQFWYESLDELVGRAGLSRPQIEQRSGVPAKTLTSWLRGDVMRPRHWQPLALVLRAVDASPSEAGALLQQAGGWEIADLARRADERDRELLALWLRAEPLFQPPDRLVSKLVGREDPLQAARVMLHNRRRCAIIGMAGVGKTSLAVELAHQLRGSYRDGIFWGDLAHSSPESILESWGQACGVDLRRIGDLHSRAARMRGIFAQKHALIILDDVVDEEVVQLLTPAHHSESGVLCTSRSYDVAQAFSRFRPGEIISLSPLSRERSLRVLADVLGDERVVQEQEPADAVARLLGDLPLALRIAAALCLNSGPEMPVRAGLSLAQMETLLQRLQTRLETLRVGQRANVRLAFEQSWALLDEGLRRAFAALAVFEGRPFSVAAFTAVARVSEASGALILAQLSRLSLLQVRDQRRHRYRQHALLAAYATEKLGEGAAEWAALIDYTYAFAEHRLAEGGEIGDEWENVMAGMAAAHRIQEWARVLAFKELLEGEWRRLGLYTMARGGYRQARDAAVALEQPETIAAIELSWGRACLEQSAYEPARRHLERALALYRVLGDAQRQGDAHRFLARTDMGTEAFDSAESGLREAWGCYQQAEDLRGMGRTLSRLASVHYNQSDYDGAIALAGDALSSLTEAADARGLLRTHRVAAQAHIHKDEFDMADRHLDAARGHMERLDDPVARADYNYTYAELCRWQRRFGDATSYAQQALAFYDQAYDTRSQVHSNLLIANIEAQWNDAEPERRRFEAGYRHIARALPLCDLIDYGMGKCYLWLVQGKLLQQQGEVPEACRVWQQGLALSLTLPYGWLQNRLREYLAAAECLS